MDQFNKCIELLVDELYNKDLALAKILYTVPSFFISKLNFFYKLLQKDKENDYNKKLFRYIIGKLTDDEIVDIYKNISNSYSTPLNILTIIFINFIPVDYQIKIIVDRIDNKRKNYNGLPTNQNYRNIDHDYKIPWDKLKPHINANLFNLDFLSVFEFDDYSDMNVFFAKYILTSNKEADWLKMRLNLQIKDKNLPKTTLEDIYIKT